MSVLNCWTLPENRWLQLSPSSATALINVENPHRVDGGNAYLYTLRATLQGSSEVIPVKVGFRR